MASQNERILIIINHFCDGNKAEFARILKEKSQTVSGWLKRENGLKVLKKISDGFPQVNYSWLLTGEGEMLKEDKPPEESKKIEFVRFNFPNLEEQQEADNTPRRATMGGKLSDVAKKLGYGEPKKEADFVKIAVKLIDDATLNPSIFVQKLTGETVLTADMLAMVTKPLIKDLKESERAIAERDAKIRELTAELAAKM